MVSNESKSSFSFKGIVYNVRRSFISDEANNLSHGSLVFGICLESYLPKQKAPFKIDNDLSISLSPGLRDGTDEEDTRTLVIRGMGKKLDGNNYLKAQQFFPGPDQDKDREEFAALLLEAATNFYRTMQDRKTSQQQLGYGNVKTQGLPEAAKNALAMIKRNMDEKKEDKKDDNVPF